MKRGSHSSSRSGSRKNRGYSVGLGRSQSGGVSEEAEDALPPNSRTLFKKCLEFQSVFSRPLMSYTTDDAFIFEKHSRKK